MIFIIILSCSEVFENDFHFQYLIDFDFHSHFLFDFDNHSQFRRFAITVPIILSITARDNACNNCANYSFHNWNPRACESAFRAGQKVSGHNVSKWLHGSISVIHYSMKTISFFIFSLDTICFFFSFSLSLLLSILLPLTSLLTIQQ